MDLQSPLLSALLVAHGAPSDPGPLADEMRVLAGRVQTAAPGWHVTGVTLAEPGALEAAIAATPAARVVPFFMAEGYFTRRELPRRLAAAGWTGVQTAAFGHAPGVEDLAAQAVAEGCAGHGLAPGAATLILAAHGSQVSRASAERTEALAGALRAMGRFGVVVTGYIEEAPRLIDVARQIMGGQIMGGQPPGPTLCLPLFAMAAGHVTGDIPEAFAAAGFTGPTLPPLGAHPGAVGVLAGLVMGT